MALSDAQIERYARILFDNDFPNHDSLWETRTDSRKLYYQIPATDVAEAARGDLLRQIADDLNGWSVINPHGQLHWPMSNILFKYDRHYLEEEDQP